ncbi:MAG: hypothetical protein NZ455_14385 [Bacteroidia bacterium]|nr:hypothetical protein [Bacteroidia bacterium]MDW8346000.1 hypothetical protein [Bacteroidia bacterium]
MISWACPFAALGPACYGLRYRFGAKPLAHFFTLAYGMGGWGRSTLARSTPSLWAYAQA